MTYMPIEHGPAWEAVLDDQVPGVDQWPRPGDCPGPCQGFGSVVIGLVTSHPCGWCAGTGHVQGRRAQETQG